MKQPLSEAELERIQAAVALAEQRTSGEIVPYIVAKSADYEVTLWRGAGLFALVASALVLLARWLCGLEHSILAERLYARSDHACGRRYRGAGRTIHACASPNARRA